MFRGLNEQDMLDTKLIVEDFQMVSPDPQGSPIMYKGKFLKLPSYRGDSERLQDTLVSGSHQRYF